MDNTNYNSNSSSLPTQRVTNKERTNAWKESSINYYLNYQSIMIYQKLVLDN